MDLLHFFCKRWIAGKEIKDVIEEARKLNQKGIGAIINFLGEEIENPQKIIETWLEYISLIRQLNFLKKTKGFNPKIPLAISIKPTQLGFFLNDNKAFRKTFDYFDMIALDAKKYDIFVWIDMEDSRFTDKTLELAMQLKEIGHHNVGVALQANLIETWRDLCLMFEKEIPVRLCKGAYTEEKCTSFQTKKEVDDNYTKLFLQASAHPKADKLLALATHDEDMLNFIHLSIEAAQSKRKFMEYQMLKGIRPDLQEKIAKSNENISIYLPYGKKRIQYVLRRLRKKYARQLILKTILDALCHH